MRLHFEESLFTAIALEDCLPLVIGEAEVFEIFFASAFASEGCSQASQDHDPF